MQFKDDFSLDSFSLHFDGSSMTLYTLSMRNRCGFFILSPYYAKWSIVLIFFQKKKLDNTMFIFSEILLTQWNLRLARVTKLVLIPNGNLSSVLPTYLFILLNFSKFLEPVHQLLTFIKIMNLIWMWPWMWPNYW